MHESEVEFRNDGHTRMTVFIEPWGTPVELPAGSVMRVAARGEQAGQLEVTDEPEGKTVWAWPSSTIDVFVDDEPAWDTDISVPDLPPGMSVQNLVNGIFGGAGQPQDRVDPDAGESNPSS